MNRFKSYDNLQKGTVSIGMLGTFASVGIFLFEPSFPTPDKIFVFALLVGLMFGQAKQVIYRLGPFAILLLVYKSFRGIADGLNQRVNFMWMVDVDRMIFGELPTKTLQDWWWNGQVQWYDFALYLPYMLHFVLPFVLAIIIWKTREQEYWRYITAFLSISFFAFLVFLAFPAAPPWMASDNQLIEPVARISSHVWYAIGLEDFPSVYDKIAPNPVAAVPSLHAGYATLFAIFVVKFFKNKWRYLVLLYPLSIYVGTVYQGEHYVIDAILGALLAVGGYWASPALSRFIGGLILKVKQLFTKTVRFNQKATDLGL